MERKTHRDTWTGESSVKERFMIEESEVKDILGDQYNIAKVKKEMQNVRGVNEEKADQWEKLAREVTQVIGSKQLVPTMRTQVR